MIAPGVSDARDTFARPVTKCRSIASNVEHLLALSPPDFNNLKGTTRLIVPPEN